MSPQHVPTRRAFTLMELVVTLVVIGLAAAVTLPALAQTRTIAQSSVAYANLKRLADAQVLYANANGLWLAGPNTTGWQSIVTHGAVIVGNTTASTPAQTQDWISPTVGDELGLSPNRAQRIHQILEFLSDPRSVRPLDQIYSEGTDSDAADFIALGASEFLQVSYLQPAPFHLRPPDSLWTPDPGVFVQPLTGFRDPATAPIDYLPRLDLVGPPSTKVAVADGTRYLAVISGTTNPTTSLDINIGAAPRYFGNFESDAPTYDRSVAYGRNALFGSFLGDNVRLSMRYPDPSSAFGRGMHVARFDGSVDFITAEQAWGEASLWYPSGSVYTGVSASVESKAIYQVGDILP